MSELIRDFREYMDISQRDFGKLINPQRPYSDQAVSAWEKGNRFPSRKTWNLIVKCARDNDYSLSSAQLYEDGT